jgi:hypothetical protein
VPEFMGMAKGEIAHVHPEGSSHVTLSLVDGEEAVRVGWYVLFLFCCRCVKTAETDTIVQGGKTPPERGAQAAAVELCYGVRPERRR